MLILFAILYITNTQQLSSLRRRILLFLLSLLGFRSQPDLPLQYVDLILKLIDHEVYLHEFLLCIVTHSKDTMEHTC